MTLYQIDNAILALVDQETGEVSDFDALDALAMERDTKIENIACYIKDCVADAAAIRAEEKALAERRGVLERKAERLKEYLAYALNGQKFESTRCAVNFRKTASVQIEDENSCMDWLEQNGHEDVLSYKAPTINKTELKRILTGGAEVPGAAIVNNLSVGVK